MKANGNLEILKSDGSVAWNTQTEGMGNSRLYVTDTAKLCIYSNDKKRYTFIGDSKLSIKDEEIRVIQKKNSKIDVLQEGEAEAHYDSNTQKTYYDTEFTNFDLGSLMLRRIDVSATVKAENMSEKELGEHIGFFVQFRNNKKSGSSEKITGGEKDLRKQSDFFLIEKTDTDTYRITEKNVPCLADEVRFGIKTDLDPGDITVSDFRFTSTDNNFKKYDVLCTNGENLHITMNYSADKSYREIWLKTLSRYINSLSDITGVRRNDIYIFEYADTLCGADCPCMDDYIIPSENSIPAILIPSDNVIPFNWKSTCRHVERSMNLIPDSIHHLYLHELGHCYATGKSFEAYFSGNVDDGYTNVRGITAIQNCEELCNTILYSENREETTYNRGRYMDAVRNLADEKWNETVNYRIMNTYANYVALYQEKGWAILEKLFEGGDPFFNDNLFSGNVQKIIRNELKKSYRVYEYKCDDLSKESYKFMNTIQFLQQNAPDKAYNNAFNPRIEIHNFIRTFMISDKGYHNYKNAFVDYFERIEKHNRGLDWEKESYLISTGEHIE
ncbi:MAG: hypothetical protein IKH78_02250 [Ruminococcus sp.]|nr:hypothetical protein [Ruminococcus sp.]